MKKCVFIIFAVLALLMAHAQEDEADEHRKKYANLAKNLIRRQSKSSLI